MNIILHLPKYGVPQGMIFSPSIFHLHINDVCSHYHQHAHHNICWQENKKMQQNKK